MTWEFYYQKIYGNQKAEEQIVETGLSQCHEGYVRFKLKVQSEHESLSDLAQLDIRTPPQYPQNLL